MVTTGVIKAGYGEVAVKAQPRVKPGCEYAFGLSTSNALGTKALEAWWEGPRFTAYAKGRAVEAVASVDSALATLQDSMLPIEVGDADLRAGLQQVRELLGGLSGRARELVRTLGLQIRGLQCPWGAR